MGTWVHVLVHGTDAVAQADSARDRLAELEALWSRFRQDSDVSRANGRRGSRVGVAAETVRLVELAAVAAAELTPYFDPCRLDDIVALGYDRSFSLLGQRVASRVPASEPPGVPGEGLLAGGGWIQVPLSGFDPGAIGKGLAADIVAEELLADGADGVLVNVGGDLRCLGIAPAELSSTGAWSVEITDESERGQLLLRLGAGGVATSSSRRRRWNTDDGPAHHVLDPLTGRSVRDAARSVTVLSDRGWRSEALATAVLVAGVERGREIVERAGAAAFVIDVAGARHHLGDLAPYVASTAAVGGAR